MPLIVIQKRPGENVSSKLLQVVKQKGRGGGWGGGGRGQVVLSPSWGNSRADVGFWHLPR